MLAFPTSGALAQDKMMKKPQPVKISVGGYFTSMIGFSDQDGSFENAAVNSLGVAGRPYRTTTILNDSEIYFTGNSTLDNGLRIDVIVQLETDQFTSNGNNGGSGAANSNNTIDESYIKLTGGFGDVRIGNTKAGSFVLGTPTLPAGIMRHDTLDVGKFVIAPTGAGATSGSGVDDPTSPFFLNGITWDVGPSDGMKIVYISPQFAGFRIGGSYWTAGAGGDKLGAASDTDNNGTTDVAIQYQNKFGDVGFNATASYVHTTDGQGFGGAPGTAGGRGYQVWNGQAAISYAGFRVSGRYGRALGNADKGGVQAASGANIDDWQYDAEILYRSGPWGVSFTYQHGNAEETKAIAADLTRTVYMFGADYAIGPGIKVGANIFRADWNDETTAPANNNDGWAVVGGIKVRF
jgi:outer membrane protein OmpU